MPDIRLEGLSKHYGETLAADDLNLSIKDGEYVCILGPTGAGKTTCMRMICGLVLPDSGRVFLDGRDATFDSPDSRNATMLTQTYALFPHLTVYNNVMFAPKIKGWPEADSKQIVRSMLHMVHLEQKADWLPGQLSGGQQQRIALARALASGSKILLLDEPLRALDARLRIDLRKELRAMAREMGLTCIHVTHDQDEALEMADRIAIIRKGRIIQFGTPAEVFDDPLTPFVANFVGRSNILSGRVVSSDGSSTVVDLGCGISVQARPSELSEGSEAVVAVKVGFTRICEPEQGCMVGKVERILYEGASITVEVSVDGIGLISARLPNRMYEDYAPGQTVGISWPVAKASVFPMPGCGLEEEMRLDRCPGSSWTGYRCASATSTPSETYPWRSATASTSRYSGRPDAGRPRSSRSYPGYGRPPRGRSMWTDATSPTFRWRTGTLGMSSRISPYSLIWISVTTWSTAPE